METWLIVLIVVAVVIALAVLAVLLSKRRHVAGARKREQAREHLQEAQVRAARAEKDQALADEEAARARRERAEVEERTALAEQQARERAERAGQQMQEAEQLRARAHELAPDLNSEGNRDHAPGSAHPDHPEGGASRR